ncbi:MAG: hypothetical protein AABX33_08795, partial [Nanoarchaeota archaeon]
MPLKKPDNLTVKIFGIWMILFLVFTLLISKTDAEKAASKMLIALAVFWVFLAGYLMHIKKGQIMEFVLKIKMNWKAKFVIFAIILALAEEAIATSITNLAPIFGAYAKEAHITASSNYIDVVLFHSVIIFLPMFIVWAYLLSRYDFKPFHVFTLFGINGILAEFMLNPNILTVVAGGFWIFVYGLMTYLPAYCIPKD